MSAEGQIKAFIERIIRLKDEQDAIGEDIKAVYAEAKSMGFDKTGLGDVVTHLRKIEKKGADTIAEKEAIFDIYLSAYQGSQAHAPARTRENIEEFDPITGEFVDAPVNPRLIKQVVDGMQTEAGRAALIAAVDIMIEREEAEEQNTHSGDSSPPDTAAVISSSHDAATGEATGIASVSPDNSPETANEPDGDAIGEVRGSARLPNAAGVEPPPSAPNERCRTPAGCKFANHPNKITCAPCGSAWSNARYAAKREREKETA